MNKNNYFKTMVLILFVLLINTSFVSVGFSSVLWTNTYGGLGEQSAASIIETDDGGFVIFGNTQIDPNLSDFLLIKIDENGFMQWNHTYDGKGETDSARSFVQTSDGGYALAGQTLSSFQYGSSDFWLIKTDAQGNMEWNKTYGQWFQDDVEEIIETSDGGFVLVGNTLSVVGKLEDYYLVKTDSYGNLMWNKTYGTGDREYGSSIVETSDGGYALAGDIWSFSNGTSAYQLFKIGLSGNVEWTQTYGWNQTFGRYSSFKVNDLVKTSDGGYALGGTARNPVSLDSEFLLIKTDEFGNMQWNQTYKEGGGPLIHTFDGGFAFAGSYYNGDTSSDAFLIKTDMNGYEEFSNNYSLTDIQQVSSLIQTSNGGFALAGRTSDNHDENSEIWVLITDEQGIPEFPSWTILPFFLIATVCAIIVKKRLFSQTS